MFAKVLPFGSRKPSSHPASRVRRSRFRLMEFDSLEQRKVLSTASSSSGLYRVDVWTEQYTPTDSDIYARVSYNGLVVNGRVAVAIRTENEVAPSVSINSSGRFVVAYVRDATSTDSDVIARVFGGGGAALTGALKVADSSKNELDPSVDINGSGQFVVAYTLQYSTSDLDVMARQYTPPSSSGASYATKSFTLASEVQDQFDPHVEVATNGNFAVSYTSRNSSADLDVKTTVFRNGIRSRYTIASSTANETDSITTSFDGSGSMSVSYLMGGVRRTRSLAI